MSLHQLYAFVTSAGWERSLSTRWPDAPLIGNYRLLVFTNEDLPKLKTEYSSATFKELTALKTIEEMKSEVVGPFTCDLETAKTIVDHFNQNEEEPS